MTTDNIIDKIWNDHLVTNLDDQTGIIRIDRVLLHDRGGGLALSRIHARDQTVANPDLVVATIDHVVDTRPERTSPSMVPDGPQFIKALREGTQTAGIQLYDLDDHRQGIIHVIAPEQGLALPGLTIACNDSHTGSLGALGALAWGVGVSDIEVGLEKQCLILPRPKTMLIELSGTLPPHNAAKDLALFVLATIGPIQARGYTIEFAGSVVANLSIEERLTLCNLATELGARTSIISPDDVTLQYLEHTNPSDDPAWDEARRYWRILRSDDGAQYDKRCEIDCSDLVPQISWGTIANQVVPVTGQVPRPADEPGSRAAAERALTYMELSPGQSLIGLSIDIAFIGSCTNSRLTDLRAAASILKGKRIAPAVKGICVPGSRQVKLAAEREGLDQIFNAAGFSWREPGCSMCFYAGGEGFAGQRIISTTNRSFENRQGAGAKTHLASPATVAASAIAGAIADPRIR